MIRIVKQELPVTPDGRYMVVRGRLWRTTNPGLDPHARQLLVRELMDARRAVGAALRQKDGELESAARRRVNAAKIGLGERGPVWWDKADGDYNQRMVIDTPYSEWFSQLRSSH